MQYNNPTPVAVAIARIRRLNGSLGLLGIVRKLTPVGGCALAGGFIDEMESATMAVVREFREEARFVTRLQQWKLYADAVSPSNRLLVFCEFQGEIHERQLEQFRETKEVSRLLCLTEETLDLCFPLHQEVAQSYLAQAKTLQLPERLLEVDDSEQL